MMLEDLFDISHTLTGNLLAAHCQRPYEALPYLHDWILQVGPTLDPQVYTDMGDGIWIATDATIAPTASIKGPCIIGSNTELRHGAFIRGSVLIGSGCVVGNSVELKNCILMDEVQVPHFNYIGDSILGWRAHFGAGSITSNVRSDKQLVRCAGEATHLSKLGALVGDRVEIGCNSVLNPGTIIGKDSVVYPLVSVRGTIAGNCIMKDGHTIITKHT